MPNIFVSTTGSDTTGNGAQNKPYATIGFALSIASAGDTIQIMDGTHIYTTSITVNKSVTIRSQNSAALSIIRKTTAGELFIIAANSPPLKQRVSASL